MGNSGNVGFVFHVFDHDDKLVAAQAANDIHGPKDLSETFRHFLEQSVAGIVTEGVVDPFEMIQIDEQNSQVTLISFRRFDGATEELAEEGAVGQPGQDVMGSEIVYLSSWRLRSVTSRAMPRKPTGSPWAFV